jgi:hypothetical protein
MNWGMITYEIPLKRYPKTYNGQPLAPVALGAQKNYNALYLMSVYMDPEREKKFRDDFLASGKKLDMGKSCLRFKSADDIPLDLIAKTVAAVSPEQFIAEYELTRAKSRKD